MTREFDWSLKPGEVGSASEGWSGFTSSSSRPAPQPGDETGGAWFPANASPVPRLINERLRGAW